MGSKIQLPPFFRPVSLSDSEQGGEWEEMGTSRMGGEDNLQEDGFQSYVELWI